MNTDQLFEYRQLYEKYAKKMDLPNDKQSGTPVNARWFIRSGYVVNRNNPHANEMLDVARKLA